MTCAACSVSNAKPPIARSLPPAPEFLRPVEVAEPKAGEPVLLVAARERAGRLQANARIRQGRQWYDRVRRGYAVK